MYLGGATLSPRAMRATHTCSYEVAEVDTAPGMRVLAPQLYSERGMVLNIFAKAKMAFLAVHATQLYIPLSQHHTMEAILGGGVDTCFPGVIPPCVDANPEFFFFSDAGSTAQCGRFSSRCM